MTRGLDVLRLIQDVDWVVGSFIADPNGELLVYSMPPEFAEEVLQRTSTRIASIVRSAEHCGVDVDQCDFSFTRYQLVMSRSTAGMVCALVEAPVSRRALSMATRIALAELPRLVAALDAAPMPELPEAAGRDLSLPPGGELPRLALPLERFGPVASVSRPE
jgi:hypothetical protein